VLIMSITSGQLITRWGRYKVFPIMGTALMTAGLALLSTLNVGTSTAESSVFLLLLGLGLGSTMQVLVLAVQNAVDFSILGAATSGVTLSRGIGGSVGTAIFGTIFSTQLRSHLTSALTALHARLGGSLAHQIAEGGRLTGTQVHRLPAPVRSAYQHAYVHSLSPVFEVAAGVAALGFLLSLMLPERPLREVARASTGLEDSLAVPRAHDSLAEIERAITKVTTRAQRMRFNERIADRAGVEITPGAVWALIRIDEHGPAQARAMAEESGVDAARISEVVSELRDRHLVAGEDGDGQLTAAGREQAELILAVRRELLCEALADEDAERDPELSALLHRLARELSGEPPVGAAAAAPATAPATGS
jgi:DNA-binding MarR family transcriptional regulator